MGPLAAIGSLVTRLGVAAASMANSIVNSASRQNNQEKDKKNKDIESFFFWLKRIIFGIFGFWLFIILIIIIIIILLIGGGSSGPTQPKCANNQPPNTNPGGTLNHTDAAQQLAAAGISIHSSGNCSDKTNPTCTSLDGIQQSTINGLVDFAKKSGLSLVVTGGTEAGHAGGTYSHGTGFKIDISSNGSDSVSQYIKNNFSYSGDRPGYHGGPTYKDQNGNEYTFETRLHHWDITYYNDVGGIGGQTNSTTGSGQVDPNCIDPGEGGFGGGGANGTLDDCDGKYTSYINKNPLKSNFGDPVCDFTKEGLKATLESGDPQNAQKWFLVASCESGYIPLAYNPNAVSSGGAWGLFQMGSQFQSNNSYDRGDVPWKNQANNAINELKIAGPGYWACW